MRASVTTCREQEALYLAKAESEPLESRRKIARDAAKAWGLEAILAEKRALRGTPLNALDTEIAAEFASEAEAGLVEDDVAE
jgi:hypothetical protein